ncbi:peroxiredoxin family protein [Halomicroarcula sp. F13]|uniref:Peroxiredoxin family protein n=1 Tax=Haloarcula rubra TaxID=2487747 RepID=A0AAW4PQH0_9EURY|nr:redoxin domain-containing protein [Halomicroarcula rubra]MBX0322755.1 peroxiredoxin family protein [Halomicroarcula rubra]
MSLEATDFSLPNVGPGPDPLSLSALAADHEFALLLFQRDHYCTNCREQVQTVAGRYDEFVDRDAEVVSIVPEPEDRVREWQDSYDLPYPLVADPDATAGDAYDQPVRFGFLGDWSDFLGRMPEAVLVDLRDGPEVVWSYRSKSTFDRPGVDDLLDAIDDARTR